MRPHRIAGALPVLFAMLLGVLAAGPAAAVNVTCGTGSGLAGQTVDIDISTSDLTGLDVRSYQFALTYNAAVVTAQGVLTPGTLTGDAGWTSVSSTITSGKISVAAAGANALPGGAGVLIRVRFVINPALLNGGFTSLAFQSFLMNEGTPPVTTANGSISVGVTPQIYVSPNSGEIIRGRSLQFSVSGSVTNPVSWDVTDPAAATISAGGLLRGLAVGSTRVFAVDAAARRDTSDGVVLVRGMGDSVGTASVVQGQNVSVPVYATRLDSLGIRSGQLGLSWNPNLLALAGVSTPPGTLLDGYGVMDVHIDNVAGTVTVGFAGTVDLTSTTTQALFQLDFTAGTSQSGFTTLSLITALFNETLPAVRANGSVVVNPLPSIGVSPATVSLLAGQTQQFTVTGSPTPPITWSTLDPSVATIHSSGLLTAVGGGVTRVKAVDNVGATALNTSVTVYDFQLNIPTLVILPGSTAHVPLQLDRAIGGLGVYSLQYTLSYPATWVTSASAPLGGLLSAWGAPTQNSQSGLLRVASAGSQALPGGGTTLHYVDITVSPSTPTGTNIPLTLSAVLFNEGHPVPLIVNGTLQVSTTTGTETAGDAGLSLAPAEPNPATEAVRIAFTLPAAASGGGHVRLAVYGLDGRRVRLLLDAPSGAGPHAVTWDTRDVGGRPVAAGIYFYRLEWGDRRLERKLALVR